MVRSIIVKIGLTGLALSPIERTSVHSPVCGGNLRADADALSCVQTTALPLAH